MAKKEDRYPRTLYKSPGNLTIHIKGQKLTYDSLIVRSQKEEQEAISSLGYVDGFSEALFGDKGEELDAQVEKDPELPDDY